MLDGILKMLVSVKLAQHLAQSFQQPMQPIVKTERYIPIKGYKRENYWYGKWTVSEPTPRNKTEADKGLKPTSNIPEVFATHRGSCL